MAAENDRPCISSFGVDIEVGWLVQTIKSMSSVCTCRICEQILDLVRTFIPCSPLPDCCSCNLRADIIIKFCPPSVSYLEISTFLPHKKKFYRPQTDKNKKQDKISLESQQNQSMSTEPLLQPKQLPSDTHEVIVVTESVHVGWEDISFAFKTHEALVYQNTIPGQDDIAARIKNASIIVCTICKLSGEDLAQAPYLSVKTFPTTESHHILASFFP